MSSLNKSQDFNPDELDAAIYSCLQRNKQNINKEKLRRIHKDCNIMYNSVNVLCGRQGSGKTFTSMKEAIKISMLSPETHLLVIVCKDETITDPTVESLKPLLQIPIVYVAEDDAVEYVAMPESGNVMVFSRSIGETLSRVMADTVVRSDGYKARILPELYFILREVGSVREYNRIVASYADGWLYLAVSQGRTLQLCNVFRAADFTTAEYYIFLVMKKLQLNPEISPVYFRTPLEPEQEMSLYRYFKDVIQI